MSNPVVEILAKVKLCRGRDGKELNYPLVRNAMLAAAQLSPTGTVSIADLKAANITAGWDRYLAFLCRSQGALFVECREPKGKRLTGYKLRPPTPLQEVHIPVLLDSQV